MALLLWVLGLLVSTSLAKEIGLKNLKDEQPPVFPTAKTFDQDIDHARETGGTFKQLYYEMLQNTGDPSNNLKFLYIGGAETLSMGSLMSDYMTDLGKYFLADLYGLEHRYYGSSQPYTSLTTTNLQYLNIKQALEDISTFIEYINNKQSAVTNKWILFGFGYAGNLAVWLRRERPELVYGVVAGSAPLEAKFNFKGYLEAVGDIIEGNSPNCYNTVHTAMKQLIHLFPTKKGRDQLAKEFKMCKPLVNQNDKYTLTSFIAGLFTDSVLHNLPSNSSNRVQDLCRSLISHEGNEISKLASLISSHYLSENSTCFDYSYDSNSDIFSTDINRYSNRRQWYYQQCTELGYFMTTSSHNQPFVHSIPPSYYVHLCKKAFGEGYTEESIKIGVLTTNYQYEGKNIKDITNVLMLQGKNDPWKSLGISSFKTKESEAVIVKDGWNFAHIVSPRESDSISLIEARMKVYSTVQQWVS